MKLYLKVFLFIIGFSLSCKNKKDEIKQSTPETHTDSISDNVIETIKPANENKKLITKQSVKVVDDPYSVKDDPFIGMEDSSCIIIGIVQNSGIRSFDSIEFETDYQIVSRHKSFYLLTALNLQRYWGKCVKVKGRLADGWDVSMTDYDYGTFGRIPLELDEINEISCDSCSWVPYPRGEIKPYTYRDNLTGYIIRSSRPSPDISWDYRIKLDISIAHPEDPDDLESRLKSLIIHPNINLDILNKIIEDSLHILTVGHITGGYGESIVFVTDSIKFLRH